MKILSQVYLYANILKRQEIEDQFQWTSSRNWPMANRLVTKSMSSHDLVKRASRRLYRKRDGIGQTPCSSERYLVGFEKSFGVLSGFNLFSGSY